MRVPSLWMRLSNTQIGLFSCKFLFVGWCLLVCLLQIGSISHRVFALRKQVGQDSDWAGFILVAQSTEQSWPGRMHEHAYLRGATMRCALF